MHPQWDVQHLHASRRYVPQGKSPPGPFLSAQGKEVKMTAVSVEISKARDTEAREEILVVSDLDDLLSSPAIAPGCGNNNPYQ